MRAVKSKDTKPELAVRSLLHRLGYRFRIHRKDVPGTPDIVFPGRRKVIFIHGCFWHQHNCVRGARVPVNNHDYWVAKIARNAARDEKHLSAIESLGWQALVLWECELRVPSLESRLQGFLQS
jgi:DNA mismatch endonuclease, patch repair protein